VSAAVANGGARRSARIAVKYWKDKEIMKFVHLKRDRPELWSSNNSVGITQSFWDEAKIPGSDGNKLYLEITKSVFQDLTGEPGLIALDKLTIK
jgi:ribonucleotide reductase alpha subunit